MLAKIIFNNSDLMHILFSREPQLYKRVCPSVGLSVGPSELLSVRNAFVLAGRDEPANNLFCVYKLLAYYMLKDDDMQFR